MITFNTRPLIEKLIAQNGHFADDPQVYRIYEFRSALNGKVKWVISYDPKDDDVYTSPYVEESMLLWSVKEGHCAPIGILEVETAEERRQLWLSLSDTA